MTNQAFDFEDITNDDLQGAAGGFGAMLLTVGYGYGYMRWRFGGQSDEPSGHRPGRRPAGLRPVSAGGQT